MIEIAMNLELPGFFSQEQLPTMLSDSLLFDADSRLKSRQERCFEAEYFLETKKWSRFVSMFQPVHWPAILTSLYDRIPTGQYLALAAEIWNSPQIDFLPTDILMHAMVNVEVETARKNLMDSQERTSFDELSEEVVLYRSHSSNNQFSLSWTPELESAKKVKQILKYDHISMAVVPKEYIAALFTRRQFPEVIIHNRYVGKLRAVVHSSSEIDPPSEQSER